MPCPRGSPYHTALSIQTTPRPSNIPQLSKKSNVPIPSTNPPPISTPSHSPYHPPLSLYSHPYSQIHSNPPISPPFSFLHYPQPSKPLPSPRPHPPLHRRRAPLPPPSRPRSHPIVQNTLGLVVRVLGVAAVVLRPSGTGFVSYIELYGEVERG